MEEEHVFFGHGEVRLEGLYAPAGGERGAVIAHPHPLMGGDMDNGVVAILTETLSVRGFSTLRFNFRGVGRSTGVFDDGRGEREDLLAALSFLETRGIPQILPVGYSFGAWVAAAVPNRRGLLPTLLVSPPIALFRFETRLSSGKTGLILCGDRDPYCPAGEIHALASALGYRCHVVAGADHFFRFREADLAAALGDDLTREIDPEIT